jgi:uncharacterized membrane protein YhaH (DUF805 family)
MQNYMEVLKKYAIFTGRARRQEYWMFYLFSILIWIAVYVFAFIFTTLISNVAGGTLFSIYILYSIAVIIPTLAVTVRRLHDTSKSAWYLLVLFIPFIGAILLLVWLCSDSTPGVNNYGPNPKEGLQIN